MRRGSAQQRERAQRRVRCDCPPGQRRCWAQRRTLVTSPRTNRAAPPQNIAAENYPFCTIDPNESRCAVPDERYDYLCDLWKPPSMWVVGGLGC